MGRFDGFRRDFSAPAASPSFRSALAGSIFESSRAFASGTAVLCAGRAVVHVIFRLLRAFCAVHQLSRRWRRPRGCSVSRGDDEAVDDAGIFLISSVVAAVTVPPQPGTS